MIWEELGEVNSHNCNYFPKVLRYSRSAELIPSVPGGRVTYILASPYRTVGASPHLKHTHLHDFILLWRPPPVPKMHLKQELKIKRYYAF